MIRFNMSAIYPRSTSLRAHLLKCSLLPVIGVRAVGGRIACLPALFLIYEYHAMNMYRVSRIVHVGVRILRREMSPNWENNTSCHRPGFVVSIFTGRQRHAPLRSFIGTSPINLAQRSEKKYLVVTSGSCSEPIRGNGRWRDGWAGL